MPIMFKSDKKSLVAASYNTEKNKDSERDSQNTFENEFTSIKKPLSISLSYGSITSSATLSFGDDVYNSVAVLTAKGSTLKRSDTGFTAQSHDDDSFNSSLCQGSSLKVTIDQAIEMVGLGRFQTTILIASGLCFAADAMEILLLSFLSVVLQSQWGLNDDESARITSGVFLGASAGTLFWGYWGDRIGRKPVLVVTAALICVFGFATALSNYLETLVVCRFMVGFGVGGSTVPFDILAELVPSSQRGRDLLLIDYFWTFGTLLVPVVAMVTLGQSTSQEDHGNEWRWFVAILGIPCLVSSIVSVIYIPESPRWLLTQGKSEQALEVLRDAATKNGKNGMELFPQGTVLLQQEGEECQNVSDLFRPQWRWTTILLWLCWGGFAITYYGTILTVTLVFAKEDKNDLESEGTYSFDFGAILASASSEIAGTTLAILLVDRIGRIPTQVGSYLGGGIFLFLLSLISSMAESTEGTYQQPKRGWLIMFAFLSRMFFMGGCCTTWISTAEILTTEVRTTGHSWSNAVARLAGAASAYLVTKGRPLSFSGSVILIISLATALVSSQLPETKGQSLGISSVTADRQGVKKSVDCSCN